MISAVNEFLDDLRGGRMEDAPVVKVEEGQLQGKVVNTPSGKGYFAFQGIPYAKPPLGSLRFKDPQPHEPWEGIRDATSEGNVSAQIDHFVSKTYVGDENCLFLNIYTPNLDGAFLPVMVYVHGGGLFFGSGNTDLYGPDFLIEKDVIVVTLNYRLGALGFLSLNTPEVPGNAGVKDVIQALRWIKDNIHHFGGNNGNLTVFGESAGGGIVSMLTASPLSKNLINRAIFQSGTALLNWFEQKTPVDNARKLAKALGSEAESPDEILEFLSATPVKELVEAAAGLTPFEGIQLDQTPNLFSMVVEKEFPGVEAVTTEPFIDMLKSGRVAQVPIMIGGTALEFSLEKKPEDWQPIIPEELNVEKNSVTSLAIVDEIKKMYFKEGEPSHLECSQLFSDRYINVTNHRYIQYLLHATNVPVYVYKFDYVGELNIFGKMTKFAIPNHAMHCDDLGYLFKNDFQKDLEPTPEDLKMRERMVRLWTNFAKTGNPTPEKSHYITVTWLPAARENENYLHLAKELSLGANYDKEKMEFWDDLYQKHFRVWDQPQSNAIEITRKEPVIVEAFTVVTSSSETTHSSETVETSSEVVETSSGWVETTSGVTQTSSGWVETSSGVTETSSAVTETSSRVVESSSGVVETSSGVVETSSGVVETSSGVVETPSEVVEIPSEVVELPSEVATVPDVIETAEVVDAPIFTEVKKIIESAGFDEKPHLNGNGVEKGVKRTSNEIKMVQNSNGVPKDVIRANDPPEDDLPKNIGVNKFVNFFESLGGKK